MSSTDADLDDVAPDADLGAVGLPDDLADALADVYGLGSPPPDAATWIDAVGRAVERTTDAPPASEDLCTVTDGAHVFDPAGGEPTRYACVLDPLIVPFLEGRPGTVRSETPGGETVRLDVSGDGVTIDPQGAVISLGVDPACASPGPPTLEDVYAAVCPSVRAFGDRAAYRAWDADASAVTTAVGADVGVAMARGLASLFEA